MARAPPHSKARQHEGLLRREGVAGATLPRLPLTGTAQITAQITAQDPLRSRPRSQGL